MSTKKRLVVVVCGWMGGSRRAVDKYAAVYTRLGCKDVVVVQNSMLDFFKADVHAATAARLQQLGDDCAFVPHLLSNGGCKSWTSIDTHMRNANHAFHVPAMVFDSAPSRGEQAAVDFTWRGARHLRTLRERLAVRLSLSALKWLPPFRPAHEQFKDHWRLCFDTYKAVPKLFLYSSRDTFVDPESIRTAMATANESATIVDAVDFATSGHVQHLATDPTRYARALQAFCAKALSPSTAINDHVQKKTKVVIQAIVTTDEAPRSQRQRRATAA
ncbi:hypothetical protein SDRG_15361 [Saprolegnia diclina VS20]|uniref:AB hydrolase-1 domain-containing protein n=1 Tax=Saprolegnia diclina (strain VS20) TaxID=1156394 RepID=T0PX68_SAPDV|nr:hypothetical protein SDRG_15361 [Saprolegnia diclina VS20]EQC26851.1 hypothetical protein SDRG_15361 [Saprolegnia diclina VS20]|eukprot:XP_008619753.1 hypothetical protein SDRG_15361 [Saprolegnia diclina VS20]